MKKAIHRFRIALRTTALGMICFAGSAGAFSQDAAPTPPDGSQAQSVLQLVPRHATLSVADLKAETNWYIEKLGFTLLPSPQMGSGRPGAGPGGPNGNRSGGASAGSGGPGAGPGGPGGKMQGVELTIPGFQMHLIQYAGSQRAKTPSPEFLAQGWIHVAFSVADPEKALNFLKAAGVDVQGGPGKDGKVGTLVVHDPEGNTIELFPR